MNTPTLHLHQTVGMKGFFKLTAFNPETGRTRILADWFPNQILNAGRNYMGENSGWLNACQVGTDGTAASPTQTALGGYVAGTTTKHLDGYAAQGSAPYYGYRRITYRFPLGAVVGIIAEAGVGWSTSGAFLFCRSLIVDDLGVPTPVVMFANEILDVTYELRYYPPLDDVLGTITLNSVVYDTITRAANVNNSTAWGVGIGDEVDPQTIITWNAYSDVIGSIIQGPSGTQDAPNLAPYTQAYSINSYQKVFECTTDLGGWVISGGIRSVLMASKLGSFQTQFAAQSGGGKVPKDNSQIMNLQWTLAWAEKV